MAVFTSKQRFFLKAKNSGFFLALAPFILLAIMGFSVLVVDLGMMRVANAQLQNATDAAALAAATGLINGNSEALSQATTIAAQNPIIGNLTASNVQVELGNWDTSTSVFTPSTTSPDAVRVTAEVTPPLFFSHLFSSNNYTVTASSTAALIGGPRDIMIVVDLSPAMKQYSQLSAYPTVSLSTITSNLQEIYEAMDLPQLGNMTWEPRTIIGTNNFILSDLGLTSVAYPFPSGSWTDYINFVKTNTALLLTGYQNQYGYLTFVDYLLSEQPQYSQTPSLWKTPEQPLQYVKDSITEYLTDGVASSDQVGLVTYNRTQGNTALLEQPLTTEFTLISSTLNGNTATNTAGRQAAHYATASNVLSAVATAIDELNANGRPEAQWIIYVFTASVFTNSGFSAVLNQVQNAATQDVTVNTITVGSDGNATLMQQIADISGGTTTITITPPTGNGISLGQQVSTSGAAALVR